MQASEDNSITVVEPTGETYVDTSLNEKNLGTQYIYTTEGQLIPASGDPPEPNLEIATQHYNSEPQNIHIEQVDYQYDEQYSTSTVETVVINDTQHVQESTYVSDATKETDVVEKQTTVKSNSVTEDQPVEAASEDLVQEVVESEGAAKETILESAEKAGEEVLPCVDPEGQVLASLKGNPIIEIQQDESVEETTQESVTFTDSLTVDTGINKDDLIKDNLETITKAVVQPMEIDNDGRNQMEQQKPIQGRKHNDFPSHLLGESVVGSGDPVVNGKSIKSRPGARLGVRVPPRNLTSRMVSRSEIENEIIERARKKEQNISAVDKKAVIINKKGNLGVTQDKPGAESKSKTDSKEVDNNANEEKKSNGKSTEEIDDNSDLLAILEGNDDTDDIPTISAGQSDAKESTPTDETNLKNLEREIALQQLHDLPFLEPKTKILKPLKFKGASPDKPAKIHIVSNSPIKSDNEEKVIVNMTLKTYSRKRKSIENSPSDILNTPPKKIKEKLVEVKPIQTISTSGDGIYVTKSSRIIKKKVIWDPDESPLKPKRAQVKSETVITPERPKNEEESTDFTKKPAAELKPKEEKRKSDVKLKMEKKGLVVKEKTPVKKTPVEKKKLTVSVEKRASLVNHGKAKVVKKGKSEVDRLLGDEGAIKMLYDLKSDRKQENEQKSGVIRVDRTFKELAKKANQIKTDLVNTSSSETPKNLRKKEPNLSPPKVSPVSAAPAIIKRQKSKDSLRSNTPPRSRSPGSGFFNNEAYLIRRRSSSSIETDDDVDTTGGSVEYEDSEVSFSKKHPITPSEDPLKTKSSMLKTPKKSQEPAPKKTEGKPEQFKTFSLKKSNKSVTIELYSGRTNYFFTSELLIELTAALAKTSREPDCLVALLKSSNNAVFSKGLDYKELISDKETVRKLKATKLAEIVKDFLNCLASFRKVLIVGIQGECAGLAVTMLPLFDLVISSDDATFSTNYVRFGSAPEAGFLLQPPFVQNGLAGRMLLACEKLTADEACRKGLVSTLCWPEKYQDTLKSTVSDVSEGNLQGIKTIKIPIMRRKIEQTKEELELLTQNLVKEWISDRCQNSFKTLN